ncbi:nifU-like protein, mitochondrial [Flavobacteriaceae bacterium UJ101]|nr:nifU-like protein, mitochondrial [Flavobacteriaceae bacterium UJ101]
MAVYIETTTVPNIVKFVNDELLTKDSFEFSTQDEASKSPLATTLLQFPFIQKVYITANFIALEKTNTIKWEDVVEELKDIINEAISSNRLFSNSTIQIPISIYAEMTPNPEVMKFVANKMLIEGMVEIKNKEEASISPVATQLFIFPFVKELFITENYISITKNNTVEWNEVSLELREEISKLLRDGIAVLKENVKLENPTVKNNSNSTKKYTSDEEAIKALLDEYVKPAVVADGGNIELIEYVPESKTVQVLLQGACSGCPSSTITLKNGIETMLKQFLPEKIESVEAING